MSEPWKNAKILRDENNNPIPQIWDGENEQFVPYEGLVKLMGVSIERAFAVSPNDTDDLPHNTIAIYVGTDGDVKLDLATEGTVTFKNLMPGYVYYIRASKIYDTGTTATDIIGVY